MAERGVALARITPERRAVAAPPAVAATPPRTREAARTLSPREKAAVVVRFLLSEGAPISLSTLPDHMQTALTEQMGQMRLVDRTTLSEVVEEFMTELEQVGLAFTGGIEGALTVMDGHISQSAASRLRRLAAASARSDPWDRLLLLPPEKLLPVLEGEAVEVAAVMLSKLPVPRAAELLGRLPGERARRVAYAVSMTGNVDPDTVRRIGAALIAQLETQPPRAFDTGPVERVGAILNVSPALTRDEVLRGLEAEDAGFAEQVRRAIFTFVHIPQRVQPRDLPKVVRVVDQAQLINALAAAAGRDGLDRAAEYILSNISQRMAQGLREEVAARGKVKEKEGEDAMTAVILAIRQLEGSGELVLIQPEDI